LVSKGDIIRLGRRFIYRLSLPTRSILYLSVFSSFLLCSCYRFAPVFLSLVLFEVGVLRSSHHAPSLLPSSLKIVLSHCLLYLIFSCRSFPFSIISSISKTSPQPYHLDNPSRRPFSPALLPQMHRYHTSSSLPPSDLLLSFFSYYDIITLLTLPTRS